MVSLAAEKTADRKASIMPPPGVAPPPGLELPQTVSPPPGLEEEAAGALDPMYVKVKPMKPRPRVNGVTVQISSLPNHLLNDAMMSATLEQARLDKFVSCFVTKPGAHRGEALITLGSMDAAIRCARHFHGRSWDASGVPVIAQLLTSWGCQASIPKAGPVQHWMAPSNFYPMTSTRAVRGSKPKPSFTLSAEAPEFVPGALEAVKMKSIIGSDVSTEDGESASSSDEKEVAP